MPFWRFRESKGTRRVGDDDETTAVAGCFPSLRRKQGRRGNQGGRLSQQPPSSRAWVLPLDSPGPLAGSKFSQKGSQGVEVEDDDWRSVESMYFSIGAQSSVGDRAPALPNLSHWDLAENPKPEPDNAFDVSVDTRAPTTPTNSSVAGSGDVAPPTGKLSPAPTKALSQVVKDCVRLFREDLYLVEACDQLLAIMAEDDMSEKHVNELLAEHGLSVEALMAKKRHVLEAGRQCRDDAGWVSVVKSEQMEVLYRHPKGSSVVGFKTRSVFDHPPEQLISLVRECDLMHTWNSQIPLSAILSQPSAVELLMYWIIWIPWPLAHREVTMEAVGADTLQDDGTFTVAFHTPKAMPVDCNPPPYKDRRVPATVVEGSAMTVTALPPSLPGGPLRTVVTVVIYIDLHVSYVPDMFLTFMMRVFMPFMYEAGVKAIDSSFQTENSPLSKRLKERSALYSRIRERCESYLRKGPA